MLEMVERERKDLLVVAVDAEHAVADDAGGV